MAKLGSFYGLCPLIDQKSLLGVSEDSTPGHVIVTLGKNMAIKYKLSDQKQVHSWSTKEKLSSPVIYDRKENRYVAIFNQQFIRVWTEHDKNLEKIKKLKFSMPIHTILYTDDEPIVIFKNGQSSTLSYTLENRTSLAQADVINKTSSIEECACLKIGGKYFASLLLSDQGKYSYLLSEPKSDDLSSVKPLKTIQLRRPNLKMNGYVAMNSENGPILLVLWSDGRLYCYPLDETATTEGHFFSVVENLSRQLTISMVALNDTYIAMYGTDKDQEGATLQIYNIQFKITQSKQHFKLFTEGSKIWSMNNMLLLTVAQNLAVIPYHLDTEQLAALVGSHKLTVSADQDISIVSEVMTGDWGRQFEPVDLPMPEKIKGTLTELIKEGWSECAICEEIFPALIEKRDNKTMLECLSFFIDIPENILVKLLAYGLSTTDKTSDVLNDGFPRDTSTLLDKVLTISYNDVVILPYLRSELKFDSVILVLQYLCYLLGDDGHVLCDLSVTASERKIFEWGSLFLDAYYQSLLLSKDPKISACLQHFKQLSDSYLVCMEDFKQTEPILNYYKYCFKNNKQHKPMTKSSLKYTIEKLKLY